MIPNETLQLIREHAQYPFNLVIEKLMIPTHNQKGRCIVLQLLSFNLVIEKLMIPTSHSVARTSHQGHSFQSRNQETYDSNIDKAKHIIIIRLFQSRNRETYDSNSITLIVVVGF